MKKKATAPQNFLNLEPEAEKKYHVSKHGCGKKTIVLRGGLFYCTRCKWDIHPLYVKDAVSDRPRGK